MSSRVKESVIPPGGWHFLQARKDSEPLRIEADSLLQLKEAVIRYRLQLSIDVGDVDREVEDYICGLTPSQCYRIGVNPEPPKGNKPGFIPLIQRIMAWREQVNLKQNRFYTNPPEAQRRAQICISCPHNVHWHTSCQPCNSDADTKLFLLRGGRQTGFDGDLHGCRVVGQCNRSAVWMDNSTLIKDNADQTPERCWLR
jgi:hypothetical protein